MKNSKKLLIYLSVAVLIGGYIYFFERGPQKTDADKKGKILKGFIADDIVGIKVENLGTTVTAEKDPVEMLKDESGTWNITLPKKIKADESAVRSVLSGAGDLAPESTVESPADLSVFNLKEPMARCTFKSKAGVVQRLLVGSKDITSSSVFVKTDTGKDVYLVQSYLLDAIVKKFSDYRDHTFFKVDSVIARKVRITHGGESMTLEKDKENIWKIISPISGKADSNKVRDFLSQVGSSRVEAFVEDNPRNLGAYGLSSPRSRVEVWFDGSGPSKSILIGRKKDPKDGHSLYYAKQGDLPGVVLVPVVLETNLEFKISDYRDKGALKFDAGSAKSLKVGRGGKTVSYQKGDDGQWKCEGRPEAQDEASSLVQQLSELAILDFPSQSSNSGLKNPTHTAEVNFGDGTKRTYQFGRQEGEKVYLASDKGAESYLVSVIVLPRLENCFRAPSTPIPLPVSSPVSK